jgi:hypothetical protein
MVLREKILYKEKKMYIFNHFNSDDKFAEQLVGS